MWSLDEVEVFVDTRPKTNVAEQVVAFTRDRPLRIRRTCQWKRQMFDISAGVE